MGLFDNLFRKDTTQITEMADLLSKQVSERLASKMLDEFSALAEVEEATAKVVELTKQLGVLRAEKDNISEGFARKEREIEHKVGLLRTEIEAGEAQKEAQYALRVQEARLAAREEGLKAREAAFTERMDFMTKRFTEEVGYLKSMVAQVLERIPDAAILGTKEIK